MVDVGKLAVLGSELLHRPSWAVDNLPPGLAKRGSVGVPMPGDDISLRPAYTAAQERVTSGSKSDMRPELVLGLIPSY